MMNRQSKKENFKEFDALKITLSSPEDILNWSYGEVTKAETINYRTLRPEPEGLFCEKIFGPSKNYECYCGKYKKIRYRGIVCDKCGVEVTTHDVRRERMGHIKLAVPAAHVWFAYGVPNKMSIVLDMSHKQLLSVIYYTRYMVVGLDNDKRATALTRLDEIRKEEFNTLESQLNESLKVEEEGFANEKKVIEKKEKDGKAKEFKVNQLEHKKNQSLAKIRREYAEQEEVLQAFYTKLQVILEKVAVGTIITEDEFVDLQDRELLFFEAKMGAEAIETLLKNLDVDAEISKLRKLVKSEKLEKKSNVIRRLQYLEGFKKNGIEPEWMVMNILPVIPPDLRPIIPLPGGKFATSDLNDLYRRIINRNNRLRRLIDIGAPEVILRNEKRMLQEAVDALIDNSHRPSKAMMNNKKLPYQSLTDELRGKKGIFRRNLLGKRVDYSGRAVIIGDATLNLNQCGLPKSIALEIFKPFVISELLRRELAPNIRVAKDIIDSNEDVIWDILEGVINNRPVLLNRAPTLHKYSIQAFYPKLVEGEAIRIHPLVCKAFNADFDGDQMPVHVLLTDDAVSEGRGVMLAERNIVSIANGKMLANPAKDMLLGFFLLTDMIEVEKPRIMGTFEDVIRAYMRRSIGITEQIIARGKGQTWRTTPGRILFNSVLPLEYEFVNERIDSSTVGKIVDSVKANYPLEVVVKLLDDLKSLGFKYATNLGFSFAMEDCAVDFDLASQIKGMEEKDKQLQENYLQGLITDQEKNKLSTDMWNDFADASGEEAWKKLDKNNSVFEMIQSGANGGKIQARQILTLKGMVRDSSGNWVPLPIKGNFRDGLNGFEYFVAANSGRKGIADRSLRTSSSGYLTRKLVDVAHEVIVREEDCGVADGEGLRVSRNDDRRLSYEDRIFGRYTAEEVKDEKGNIIVPKNEAISRELAQEIDKAGIDNVVVRTPITCKTPLGVCQKCYGFDLEQNKVIEMGKAVGVIAAQSLGEPGTQMTMQTFHKGGVQRTDITQGLPRIEELFEARTPKNEAEMSTVDGVAKIETQEDGSATVTIKGKRTLTRFYIVSDAKKINVSHESKVKNGEVMYLDHEGAERQAPFAGDVTIEGGLLKLQGEKKAEETLSILPGQALVINDGDEVYAGQQVTEGSLDPKKLAMTTKIMTAQKYILDGVQKVFNEQGVSISDVHIEVILRQMARLGRVRESGDSSYLVGALVNRFVGDVKNEMLVAEGRNKALILPKLMGIKASALYTESFLSAMSFEQQVKVLTDASILGKIDYIRGMKESVIIGKPIPSGETARIEDKTKLEEVNI
ncbi:MAG: DNA-directed RNA polymerase subunit beta' [candidate division WS6 bacterium GW2011_GWF2_39_15]|uniref:DNA-directed RNA polymerase subunit beta' n=1 Tax=candidate division WS6 bacterium GW2011_GWF2_39_15 TaxID=1619100 RepID=A0A0G0QV60_9BACT|nr:MAG: DNA-directed RNA polymerase subunit beta' [candidate division WS6 bacterium GW2011_GWF2_39_15]